MPATSERQKTLQDLKYNEQLTKWPEKENCSETKEGKRKKEDKNDDDKEKK